MLKLKKTFVIILLLPAVVAVQPLYLHVCRADETQAADRSVQTNPLKPSTETRAADGGEVLIGYFGPDDPHHPEGGSMWCAASLAVEQANKAGGYKGRSFKLVSGWSDNPWGSGVKNVAEMAFQYNVCAIIGGIDGPSTHLAEQVVAKARLPLLSAANADRTANLANVPWMFSSLPGHHIQAAALAGAIKSLGGQENFIIVSSVDHDSHLLTVELNKCFRTERISPTYHFDFKAEQANLTELIDRIIKLNAKAVVIAAPLKDTARLCIGLRERQFEGAIFGGPCMSIPSFMDLAGHAEDGVIFPILCEPSKKAADFEKDFFDHFARHSDYLAAHTYDTVSILIKAIRRTGLDRQRIRDEIEKLSPYSGVTGTISWDRQGSNSRPVSIGTISKGRVRILLRHNDVIYPRPASSTRPR